MTNVSSQQTNIDPFPHPSRIYYANNVTHIHEHEHKYNDLDFPNNSFWDQHVHIIILWILTRKLVGTHLEVFIYYFLLSIKNLYIFNLLLFIIPI